ncbi:hypothetical protein AAG570_010091 [Ranatra chinensis]|uniref:G-protein coupled receptors family 1 profile domain-containing protein n=1 Tax=Ranatra chinensis TaxID=642074 RepID=A0ABD0Z9W3_9HEMI
MIARYHRHRIARAIFEVTLSAQVTITHQKNPFLVAGGGGGARSASASVLQLVGSMAVLYLPYYGLVVWQAWASSQPAQPLVAVASGLLACSPSLNGILYGLRSKLLRRTVRHYWRKKMTKSELNQEIQARTPSRRPSLTPQRVWRPMSTSALGLSPRGSGAPLRHSATSTSILGQRQGGASSSNECDPHQARIRVRLGGSSSSLSGESDVTTQEEEREWRWTLAASSISLPTT